jgi:flagellar L-ring protein precursor FlgH
MNAFLKIILLTSVLASATNYSLFTDKRGRKSGDIITVLVLEAAKASNDTRTATDTKTNMEIASEKGGGFLKWIPGFGIKGGAGVGFDGKGATARNGELKATVTARIIQVFENGNLQIEGAKLVTINNEEEILEVSGMLRADDINPDNTVFSTKLADAVIRYSGNGVNSDAQEPGVITRFFNWLF